MAADDILEMRLKDFYDRVPDIEDALPFKDYLLKHEDSRMAWYLLGKQYAAKGQEAKANYCFQHAGEIYEAFESKPLPPMSAPAAPAKRSRHKVRILLTAVLLTAAGLTVPAWQAFAPGGDTAVSQTHTPAASSDVSGVPTTIGSISPAEEPAKTPDAAGPPGMVSAAVEPAGDGREALGELLMQKPVRTPLVLVRAEPIGEWSDWLRSSDPVASVSSGDKPGTTVVHWHDSAWCTCVPADPGNLRQTVNMWKPVQEEKLVLLSALAQYRRKFGAFPDSPQGLAGQYPANLMAGWTEAMTAWFAQLNDSKTAKDREQLPVPGWPTAPALGPADGKAVPSGVWHDLTDHPLEIIVDKTHHRLAVVSGRVLLRNYEVGLGGNRTPEGGFEISEKVREPVGKTKGVFGSRGMTLSDTRYAIHGTNEPDSVDKDESQGCIRMSNDDLEELYDLVPIGTKVTIINGGLPSETRVPPERFRLPAAQDETNPHKVYDWLD